MRLRSVYRLILILILSLSLQSGCIPFLTRSQPSAHTIRIGIIESLTGRDAEIGRVTIDAAKLAAQETNTRGGIEVAGKRYRVELIIRDAQSASETAAKVAQSLINQENVVAIVGPQYSRYAIPVSRLAEQAHIPMISPRSTNPETTVGKRYVFRAIFIDTFQGDVVARFARSHLKAQRAAVLYDVASPYNQGIAAVFKQVFTQQGGRVVAFESYTTGEKDFTASLKTIRDRRPDVLFLPNYENEVPTQAQQARQLGIRATLLGADAWGSLHAPDRQPLEGAYFSDQYIPETDNATTQGFIHRYHQTYGYEPEANAAATYDSLGLLFKAIEKQGADPEAIRQGLAKFGEYHGVTGVLDYQGTGDPRTSVAILQIKQGKVVFHQEIKPARAASPAS